jgi:hypothetical protein
MSSRWQRVGKPLQFSTTNAGTQVLVGWSWRIQRAGESPRYVSVEVVARPSRVTDLSEEARHAIRSRGATAVDRFLCLEPPPDRIIVSAIEVSPGDEVPA